MKINTEYEGEVEFSEEDIIKFPEGIYGFPNSREYVIIGEMTTDFPFVWLQSITEADVHFLLTNPFLFTNEYDFVLKDDFIEKVSVKSIKEIEVFSMVIIPENLEDTTINLKSPLIFNSINRLAKQAVLDEDFPFKFRIFDHVKEGS
jgi:flagellar assembly factor FliW